MSNLQLLKEQGIEVSEPVWAREPKCYLTKRIRRKHRPDKGPKFESKITTSSKNFEAWVTRYKEGKLTNDEWSRMTPAMRLHVSRTK